MFNLLKFPGCYLAYFSLLDISCKLEVTPIVLMIRVTHFRLEHMGVLYMVFLKGFLYIGLYIKILPEWIHVKFNSDYIRDEKEEVPLTFRYTLFLCFLNFLALCILYCLIIHLISSPVASCCIWNEI